MDSYIWFLPVDDSAKAWLFDLTWKLYQLGIGR